MVGIKVPIQELIRLVYFLLHLLNPIYKRTSKKTLIIFVRLCRNYTKNTHSIFCWFLFQNKHFFYLNNAISYSLIKRQQNISLIVCVQAQSSSLILYYIKILSIFVCNLLKLPFFVKNFLVNVFFLKRWSLWIIFGKLPFLLSILLLFFNI